MLSIGTIENYSQVEDPSIRINGIMLMELDSAHPSNAAIIAGGIGQSSVSLRITSQPGQSIWSGVFLFYEKTNFT